MSIRPNLLDLPLELLAYLLLHLSTESFLQTILTCKHLFNLASQSRDAVIAHLENLPGIKLGLEASSKISTPELFLLVRQRASANLLGAQFHANCTDVRFRHDLLDPSASCLRESADYFNISLALKNSLTVRHCGSSCRLLRESINSPYADGSGKVIQTVQGKHTVSVLYAWEPEDADGSIACPRMLTFRPPSPQRATLTPTKDRVTQNRKHTYSDDRLEYHLVHYNAYNADRPVFFHLPLPDLDSMNLDGRDVSFANDLICVPIHLAVHHRRKCVVTWRVSQVGHHKPGLTPSLVILYETDHLPHNQAGHYTSTVLFPLRKPSKRATTNEPSNTRDAVTLLWEQNRSYLAKFRPRATCFSDDGLRLKLYHAGSLAPYANVPTESNLNLSESPCSDDSWQYHNKLCTQDQSFRVDTPFRGSHAYDISYADTDDGNRATKRCTLGYLSLASLSNEDQPAGRDRGSPDDPIYVLQSHEEIDSEECDHHVSSDPPVASGPHFEKRIVARLRGLSEHLCDTTMTSLDTISISTKGRRIAIACWDKVLVYALTPSVLLEPWVAGIDEASENGSDHGDDQSSESHTVSDVSDLANSHSGNALSSIVIVESESLPSPAPISSRATVKATKYYKLTDYPSFGEIVEFWPVVLQLPNNAVARKMIWSVKTEDAFAEINAGSEDEVLQASDDEDGSQDEDADGDHRGDVDVVSERPHRPIMLGTDDFLVNHALLQDDDQAASDSDSTSDFDAQSFESVESPSPPEAQLTPEVDQTEPRPVDPAKAHTVAEPLVTRFPSASTTKSPGINDTTTLPPSSSAAATADSQPKPKSKGKESEFLPLEPSNADAATASQPQPQKPKPRRKRRCEDELIILTDRGLQAWDLGPRASGKRAWRWLDVRQEEGVGAETI